MSNMSYCRFRNTLNDLRDCQNAFESAREGEEHDQLSRDEAMAFIEMIEVMQGFLEEIDDNNNPGEEIYDIDSLQAAFPNLTDF